MGLVIHFVFLLLCVTAQEMQLKRPPPAANGREAAPTCSQVLFPHQPSGNNSNSSECRCVNKTQVICPRMSSKSLMVTYNSYNRQISFSGENVKKKFEIVIHHVRPYVQALQPKLLQVSMCCSQEVPLNTSFDQHENSTWNKHLSVLHVEDIPSPITLRKLDLSENCFKKINGKFGIKFSKLQELDLTKNLFTGFPSGSFEVLRQLQKLYLQKNRIRNLSRATFKGLKALTILTLNSNNIETLPEDVFQDLINLQILDLGINKIQTLPAGLFHRNGLLRAVTFESNALTTLSPSILSPLLRLKFFSAYDNHLESIPSEIFNGLLELSEVRLNLNRLQSIPPDLFKTNGIMLKLDLSWNNLGEMPLLNFSPLWGEPIQYIGIKYNNITSIVLPLTKYISTYVSELDLSGNCIQQLERPTEDNSTLRFYDDSGIFGFTCQECCLETIMPELLQGVLETANFSKNRIREIDMDMLKSFVNLRTVDLSDNLIGTPNVSYGYPIFKNATQRPYESLKTRIILRGNPIVCDCHIMPFLSMVKRNFTSSNTNLKRTNVTFELKGARCDQPYSLRGKNLWQFRNPPFSEKLICNSTANCPTGCHCYLRAADSAHVVNCSNQGLVTFPRIERVPPPIELHLENNAIVQLPSKESSLWQNLTGLYLQGNRIKSTKNISGASNLMVIELNGNLLTQFEDSMRLLLSVKGVRGTLSDNPWECNCRLQTMKSVMVSFGTVKDFTKVKCTNPKTHQVTFLVNTTEYDLCPLPWHNQLLFKVLLSSAAAVVVVSSLAAALFFRYKDELYLWLFKNGYCLGLVTEEDIDYTKLFDAFVSCSNKDDQWVASNLLHGLEQGTPPYSLCIHSRNWPVGGWIPDQIILSVQQSRRTIIILTENFLESHWSRLEFRTAYEQALTEPAVNRVLIIVPYEVPEVLDPILSGFIKINTYIKWDDPHFWRKLRCAMPRVKPNIRRKAASMYQLTDKFVMLPTNVKSSMIHV